MSWNRKKTVLAGAALVAACVGYVGWYYVWPRYLLKQAEQAMAANDLVRAEEVLQRLNRHDPRNGRARFLLAQVLRRRQRPDKAEEALRQARRLGYPEIECQRERVLQAEQAIATNDLVRAEQVLQSLNRHDPQNGRVRFLLAQVFRRRQRPDKAEEALRQARRLGYPEIECQRERVLNEAVIEFSPLTADALIKLLNDKPDDEEALQALGEGYSRLHNWTEAERYLTRLIEQHPDKVEAWLQRGQVRQAARERDQNHDDAAADYREVIRRAPEHFRARLSLAECLLSDARIADAKRELLICRQLNPAHPEPLIGLAICAAEEQDLQQAQALLAQALKLEPTSMIALSMQGDLCLRRKEYAEAIRFYQKVLSFDPANLAVHLNLAQAFRHIGRLEDAKNEEARFQQLRQQKGKGSSAP